MLSLISKDTAGSPISCYTNGPESFGISYRDGEVDVVISEYTGSDPRMLNSRPLHCSELHNLLREIFFAQGNFKTGRINPETSREEFKYVNVLNVNKTSNSGIVFFADPKSKNDPVVNLGPTEKTAWEDAIEEFKSTHNIPDSKTTIKPGSLKNYYDLCGPGDYTSSIFIGRLGNTGGILEIDISYVKSGKLYSRNFIIPLLGSSIRSLSIGQDVQLEILQDEIRLSSENPEVTEYIIESCRLVIT